MAERRKRTKKYCGPKRMIDEKELAQLDASGDYVLEEKHDGDWALVTVGRDGKIAGIESRTGLSFGGTKVRGLVGLDIEVPNAMLVAEMVADNINGKKVGQRRLHLFDMIQFEGQDTRKLPLESRRERLEWVHGRISTQASDLVLLVDQIEDDFVAAYEEIVKDGGEGGVVKLKSSLYNPLNSDGKIEDWKRIKPKRYVDYVIMSHDVAEKGTPNFQLGLLKKTKTGVRPVKVMNVSVPVELRGANLNRLVGKVVECSGWEMFPSGALRHAHVERVRKDKPASQCTYEAAVRG
jgi:ATP-dependent DNA ligase